MGSFIRWLLVLVFVPIAVACDGEKYSGDGEFVDYGRSEASWRYVLTLGEVYLDRYSSYSFTLSGLPGGDYVLGLVIQESGLWAKDNRLGAVVKYQITDSNDFVVSQSQVPFYEWVWSIPSDRQAAFVYVRGPESQFTALANATYRLSVEVQPVTKDKSTPLSGRLELRSQGWK